MRILWIAAISVSWQFSDAHFFMPNFLCIPPFVAINGSCLIPPITKPLIPPCLKNPQNLNLFPENRKIVTVSPWNFLPEDDDSIGKNISEDKEPSLPIKVPVKPITQNSPSAGAVEGGNKHQRLKPIPGTRPGNPSMNPKISQTHELGIGILPSKKPTKIPLPPALPSDLRLPKDPSMPDTVPVTDLTIPDADKLTDGILPSIDLPRDLLTPEVPSNPKEISKIEPTNPIIPDTDEIINRLLPSERPNQIQLPGIPGSKPPMLPKIAKPDHLINGKLPSRDSIGKQHPSKNRKTPNTDEVNRLLPSERPNQITLPGITGVGSETQPKVPPLPVTDNLVDPLKPPKIPLHKIPGSKPPMLPKIPNTEHLINGKLPSGDLIGKQHPSINPKIPDDNEVINGLLPYERPNQIQLPGITGVGSGTQLIDPTLPGTDNSEDLLKPPGIPPLEMPGSNQQIHPKIPKTDHLINGELPSADLIAKPDPPKINLPGMPKIIDPKIPKMIRPEDLYPKEINIYQLLPKDIFY
ncbi:protein PELPK1 isoform X4 [Drosophila yakuba]|uniref:protein PELPK1 isoform X4 n=1 Tax=Drosophila yakuba TaxID=7245 RepID=UPI00193074D7|nr:protein PELPK1 isoform X4 [Drosophila yakuba]